MTIRQTDCAHAGNHSQITNRRLPIFRTMSTRNENKNNQNDGNDEDNELEMTDNAKANDDNSEDDQGNKVTPTKIRQNTRR